MKNYSGYNVSFNYPQNWHLTTFVDKSGENHMIVVTENASSFNPTLFEVQSINNNGMSEQDAINEMQNSTMDGATKISNDTITLDGETAYENIFLVNNTHETDMKVNHIYFEKNGITYAITLQAREIYYDSEKSNFDIFLKSFKVMNN